MSWDALALTTEVIASTAMALEIDRAGFCAWNISGVAALSLVTHCVAAAFVAIGVFHAEKGARPKRCIRRAWIVRLFGWWTRVLGGVLWDGVRLRVVWTYKLATRSGLPGRAFGSQAVVLRGTIGIFAAIDAIALALAREEYQPTQQACQ